MLFLNYFLISAILRLNILANFILVQARRNEIDIGGAASEAS